MQEIWVRSLGQEDALEKEMETHSCILACEIPCMEEPGRLQSMGSQKSKTRFSNQTATAIIFHYIVYCKYLTSPQLNND